MLGGMAIATSDDDGASSDAHAGSTSDGYPDLGGGEDEDGFGASAPAQNSRTKAAQVEAPAPPLPPRPPPQHTMRVPQEAVKDLLFAWDFMRSFTSAARLPSFKLDDLQTALLANAAATGISAAVAGTAVALGGRTRVPPMLSALHMILLRLALRRRSDGAAMNDAEMAQATLAPVRRVLGDLLNGATWPEVLRMLLVAHDRYNTVLYARRCGNGASWVEPGDCLAVAVRQLAICGYPGLAVTHSAALLRALVEDVLETSLVRGIVDEQMDCSQTLLAARMAAEQVEVDVGIALEKGELRPDGLPVTDREVMAAREAKKRAVEHYNVAVSTFSIRGAPVGTDRAGARYWCFPADKLRCHVELNGGMHWLQYRSQSELRRLIASLDPRHRDEGALRLRLEQNFVSIAAGLSDTEAPNAQTAGGSAGGSKGSQQRGAPSAGSAGGTAGVAASSASGLTTAETASVTTGATSGAASGDTAGCSTAGDAATAVRAVTVMHSQTLLGPAAVAAALASAEAAADSSAMSETVVSSDTTNSSNDGAAEPTSSMLDGGDVVDFMAEHRADDVRRSKRAKSPQVPAWQHFNVDMSNKGVQALMAELATVEEQMSMLKGAADVCATKDWAARIASAAVTTNYQDPWTLIAPLLEMEETLFKLFVTTCYRAMDWSSLTSTEGDAAAATWESPYDWSALRRARKKGSATLAAGGFGKLVEIAPEGQILPPEDPAAAAEAAAELAASQEGDAPEWVLASRVLSRLVTPREVKKPVKEESKPAANGAPAVAAAGGAKAAPGAKAAAANGASSKKGRASSASRVAMEIEMQEAEDGGEGAEEDEDAEAEPDAEEEALYPEAEFEDEQLRWEKERDAIALAPLKEGLLGAMSEEPRERQAFKAAVSAATSMPTIAAAIFAFSQRASKVLPTLAEQELEDEAVLAGAAQDPNGNAGPNPVLFLKCTPTGEVVWARLQRQGFPWWPAVIVRPDNPQLDSVLRRAGDRLICFMGEPKQQLVSHKAVKPFIGGRVDEIARKASRTNKSLVKAMKMATKALMTAHESMGLERDPNAPGNRPVFVDPAAVAAAVAAANKPRKAAGEEGDNEDAAEAKPRDPEAEAAAAAAEAAAKAKAEEEAAEAAAFAAAGIRKPRAAAAGAQRATLAAGAKLAHVAARASAAAKVRGGLLENSGRRSSRKGASATSGDGETTAGSVDGDGGAGEESAEDLLPTRERASGRKRKMTAAAAAAAQSGLMNMSYLGDAEVPEEKPVATGRRRGRKSAKALAAEADTAAAAAPAAGEGGEAEETSGVMSPGESTPSPPPQPPSRKSGAGGRGAAAAAAADRPAPAAAAARSGSRRELPEDAEGEAAAAAAKPERRLPPPPPRPQLTEQQMRQWQEQQMQQHDMQLQQIQWAQQQRVQMAWQQAQAEQSAAGLPVALPGLHMPQGGSSVARSESYARRSESSAARSEGSAAAGFPNMGQYHQVMAGQPQQQWGQPLQPAVTPMDSFSFNPNFNYGGNVPGAQVQQQQQQVFTLQPPPQWSAAAPTQQGDGSGMHRNGARQDNISGGGGGGSGGAPAERGQEQAERSTAV